MKPWNQLNTPHIVRILKLTPASIQQRHYCHIWNSDLQKKQLQHQTDKIIIIKDA